MSTPDNPFSGRTLYASPDSSAAVAASAAEGTDEAAAFTDLAETPTAIWLLPEVHPTASITDFVYAVMADAVTRSQVPVFVVYGIPGRDCGNFSAGGLDAEEYPHWVSAIAAGLGSYEAILVVEPDALALSPSCDSEEGTTALVAEAVSRLSLATGATIYLDGGHSHWLPPEQMAPLLLAAGVERVRGFSTNVSNFNTTEDERAYAEALSELLDGAHYVIDTSRNGNGSNGEWCNPSGRAIGDTPTGVDDGSAQDASLWIKNPGESDGECNGGPAAGHWYPAQAIELSRGGR